MIYFAPICSTIPPIVGRFGRSLLALPLCLLLISCDSASSNNNQSMTTQFAPASTVEDSEGQKAQNSAQEDTKRQSDANDELDESAEGQSLIAAAQSSNDIHTNQSMMSSDASSALQATLMGDYGGMVPCQSCGSIDVTLNLFADGSVVKTSIYNNPEQPQAPLLESGIYRQDNNVITIVYEDKNIETYHIQDNHLILMDEYKNPNNDYILSRK